MNSNENQKQDRWGNEVNILVTGASSPLGEMVIHRLLEDSRVGKILAVCDKGAPITIAKNPRLESVTQDLRRQRGLHDLLFGKARDMNIEVVVHTSQEMKATRTGASAHALNVEAVRAILDFSERHPTIKRLVMRSCVEVYQVQRDLPALISEEHPLNINSGTPQWVRDRVESDITACTRMGLASYEILVLRMAEILAPGTGSQMYDYLQSRICLRPIGFDPMLNFLSLQDAATAIYRGVFANQQGVFNIPGADSLPLSQVISHWNRTSFPLLEHQISLYYRFRQTFLGGQFRYGMNRRRFHYSGILDGRRAGMILKYIPSSPISWPDESSMDFSDS